MTEEICGREIQFSNVLFYMVMVDDFIKNGVPEEAAHELAYQDLVSLGLE